MLPDIATCLAARSRRDEHFSGVFVVGDGSRFCVSHCPSRLPARSRMTIFASAPAALAAGLEPCARCTPLTAPRIPDWRIENRSVVGALRLIQRGFLHSNSTQALAARLGVSAGELRKHFIAELGVSPSGWSKAQAQHIKSQQQATRGSARTEPLKFVVPLREPFDDRWVFEFLDKRSLPGVEEVVDGCYRRRINTRANVEQWLSVRYSKGELSVELPRALRHQSTELLARVCHVFDVHADPQVIDSTLKKEAWLGPQVTGGMRVPGAWDGFETGVRAILGQQVSVARARTLAIELMQRFGSGGFPSPEALVEADVSAVGMPGKRGEAVRQLAAATLSGALQLDNAVDAQTQFETLCALPGIGPWTAGYVAMRIAGDANAFPRGDWVILKQLGMTAAVAERYSHRWAPFRAYALMYIWQASSS